MTETEATAPRAGTAKYDLTRTISKYLDLHMMFPLLDFVEVANLYPGDQVAQARLDLLDATNMVRNQPLGERTILYSSAVPNILQQGETSFLRICSAPWGFSSLVVGAEMMLVRLQLRPCDDRLAVSKDYRR